MIDNAIMELYDFAPHEQSQARYCMFECTRTCEGWQDCQIVQRNLAKKKGGAN